MLLVPDSVLSLSVLTIGSGAVLVVESEGARALLLLEESRLRSRRMECKDTTFILIQYVENTSRWISASSQNGLS